MNKLIRTVKIPNYPLKKGLMVNVYFLKNRGLSSHSSVLTWKMTDLYDWYSCAFAAKLSWTNCWLYYYLCTHVMSMSWHGKSELNLEDIWYFTLFYILYSNCHGIKDFTFIFTQYTILSSFHVLCYVEFISD